MAAPTLTQVSANLTDTTGAWLSTIFLAGSNPVTAGRVLIIHCLQDGATGSAVTQTTGVTSLSGTPDVATVIGTFSVGASAALHHLWIGRVPSSGSLTIGGTNSSTEDLYIRAYEFANVNSGTTLADVLENGSAGSVASGSGDVAQIDDVGVTTLGVDRLALNFVAVNDDNALDAFTGMTGGTWVEPTAEHADATGTDGAIGICTAGMATAGTINGGTDTMALADAWGVVGFALIGTTVAAGQPGWVSRKSARALARRRMMQRWTRNAHGILVPDHPMFLPEGVR